MVSRFQFVVVVSHADILPGTMWHLRRPPGNRRGVLGGHGRRHFEGPGAFSLGMKRAEEAWVFLPSHNRVV